MSANFKPQRTAAASRGFLAMAQLSFLSSFILVCSVRSAR